jgi:hypothetical protein
MIGYAPPKKWIFSLAWPIILLYNIIKLAVKVLVNSEERKLNRQIEKVRKEQRLLDLRRTLECEEDKYQKSLDRLTLP